MHASSSSVRVRAWGTRRLVVLCGAVLGGCGGSHESKPPTATAATEPEHGLQGEATTAAPFDDRANAQQARGDVAVARLSDAQLTRIVREAVLRVDGLSPGARNVNVTAKGGCVTLRGRVSSQGERTRVHQAARYAAGRAIVVDELQLEK